MAKKVLIPVDSTPAASNAYEEVRAAIPEDVDVVFVRVLMPHEKSERSRAQAGLVRCLMVYRTRGVKSEMQLIEADSVSQGIVDAISESDIDEVLCVQGHGSDDVTELIAALGDLPGIPVNVVVEQSETVPSV